MQGVAAATINVTGTVRGELFAERDSKEIAPFKVVGVVIPETSKTALVLPGVVPEPEDTDSQVPPVAFAVYGNATFVEFTLRVTGGGGGLPMV